MLRSGRNSIFSHPKRTGVVVASAGTVALLIPTILKLDPLGSANRRARSERNDAQDKVDRTFKKLKKILAHIEEDKQRIVDLDCAMAHYPGFNHDLISFQKKFNSTGAVPLDLWQLRFVPDETTKEQHEIEKSWEEKERRYRWVCKKTCTKDSSGKETCTETCGWESYYEYVRHYYTETTRIVNNFANIITGSRLSYKMDCGFYSRKFETSSPINYVIKESPHRESGDKWEGRTYIDFSRDFASRLPVSFLLDEVITDSTMNVLRYVTMEKAAEVLIEKLQQFLSLAIATFNMTGAKYPELQESFRREIPKLIAEAATVNATLQEEKLVLAQKQTVLDEADSEFKAGLRLWLPLLFLLPSALGLLTYLVISLGKKVFNREDELAEVLGSLGVLNEEPDDLEPGAAPQDQPLPAEAQPVTSPVRAFGVFSANDRDTNVGEALYVAFR